MPACARSSSTPHRLSRRSPIAGSTIRRPTGSRSRRARGHHARRDSRRTRRRRDRGHRPHRTAARDRAPLQRHCGTSSSWAPARAATWTRRRSPRSASASTPSRATATPRSPSARSRCSGMRREGLARMDRGMRAGRWLRTEGVQLTGKTLGLIGFGGIAAEAARLALGIGMRVIAWNRTPKSHPGVRFVELDDAARGERCGLAAPAARRQTRGFLSARPHRGAQARRAAREHGARRARRRRRDGRGAALAGTSRTPASTSTPSSRCPRDTC